MNRYIVYFKDGDKTLTFAETEAEARANATEFEKKPITNVKLEKGHV